jgi:hypothetical protein
VRRALSVSVLVGLVLGFGAAPNAQAAAPPTLTDELLLADDSFDMGSPGSITFTCRNNPDGTDTILLDAAGVARGAYAGGFDEHVEMKLRAGPDSLQVDLLSLRADFSIRSSAGQISGTKRLPAPIDNGAYPFGRCDPDDQSNGGRYVDGIDLDYSATIVSSAGVFTDRGTANLTTEPVDFQAGRITSTLTQRFSSSLAVPEQNESALFGQRVPGGSFSAMSMNTKRASPFTLFASATVRKVYAYVDGRGASSGSQTIRAVLYRNSGGQPAAFVARSFDFAVPAGMSGRWVPLYLAPPAQLNPGVYWIGIQSGATNGVARFAWNSKPNSRRFNIDVFSDGASNPFGTSSADDQQLSTFAAGSY